MIKRLTKQLLNMKINFSLRNLPVGVLIGGIATLMMTLVLIIAIFANHRVLRDSKRRDLMALQYYEANIQTRDIRAAIERQVSAAGQDGYRWVLTQRGNLQQVGPSTAPASLTNELLSLITGEATKNPWGIILAGQDLFVFSQTTQNGSITVKASRATANGIFQLVPGAATLIYVLDRKGHLIHSSRQISHDIAGRELVQRFIRIPMRSAQLEITDKDKNILGSFQDIEDTNLVYFVEMNLSELETTMRQALWQQLLLTFFSALALILILVAPLAQLRHQLFGVARALRGLAQSPGDLRMPAFLMGAEFDSIQENLVTLGQSLARGGRSPDMVIPDSNVSPEPGFVEYAVPHGRMSQDDSTWLACRASKDDMRWLFLIARAESNLNPGVQRSFFAGVFPVLTATGMSCDNSGKTLARNTHDEITRAWAQAFGGDHNLQYCFGVVERNTRKLLVVTKDFFVSPGGAVKSIQDPPSEDAAAPRVFDIGAGGFVAIIPRDHLREHEITQVSTSVAAISPLQDLSGVREQVESTAMSAGLSDGAFVFRMKS